MGFRRIIDVSLGPVYDALGPSMGPSADDGMRPVATYHHRHLDAMALGVAVICGKNKAYLTTPCRSRSMIMHFNRT